MANEKPFFDKPFFLEWVLDTIPAMIYVRDLDGDRLLYVNASFEKMLNITHAKLKSNPTAWLDAVHPEDRELVAGFTGPRNKDGDFEITFRIIHPDGSIRWFQTKGITIKNPSGKPAMSAGIAYDITDLKEALNINTKLLQERDRLLFQLKSLADTDALTSIFNRRAFLNLAEHEFARAKRLERALTAMMLDIDSFKLYNDHYGHTAGDRVIHAVAKCCQSSVRSIDIIGRYGGDEFCILIPEVNPELVMEIAERMRANIESLSRSPELNLKKRITVSIGVANLTEDMPNLVALIDDADKALYKAKARGGNQSMAY
jgi:diguanylate cyclase (GGDEF)-like protein